MTLRTSRRLMISSLPIQLSRWVALGWLATTALRCASELVAVAAARDGMGTAAVRQAASGYALRALPYSGCSVWTPEALESLAERHGHVWK
jgi:hypothetical protein